MTYKYYMNDKPMDQKEVKKKYGKQLLDQMIRSMGYRPKDKKDKTA